MAAKTVEFNQAFLMEEDRKFECIYNEFLKDYKIIMLRLTPVKLLEKSLVWMPPRQRKDEYIRTWCGRYLKKRTSVPSDLVLYRTLCNRLDRLPSSRQLQTIAAIKTITAII